jgi:hypothetical protein
MKQWKIKAWVVQHKGDEESIIEREEKAHTRKSAKIAFKKRYRDRYDVGIISIEEQNND